MATKKKVETAVLPATVKVGGFDVMIRAMAGNEEAYSGAGGTYGWGQVNISLDSPPQRVAMTLVHELLHACFEHSGLRYKFQDVNGQDIEEEIVSSLGFTLTQMIGSEDEFVEFVRNAFAGKPIEVTQECVQVPISGNWFLSDEQGGKPVCVKPVRRAKKTVRKL